MYRAGGSGRVMYHFFNKLHGAQAVRVEGEVSGVVNVKDGLIDCHHPSSALLLVLVAPCPPGLIV